MIVNSNQSWFIVLMQMHKTGKIYKAIKNIDNQNKTT